MDRRAQPVVADEGDFDNDYEDDNFNEYDGLYGHYEYMDYMDLEGDF